MWVIKLWLCLHPCLSFSQVETLRTSGSSGSGEGLFVELKTTIMRVEDLQAQAMTFDMDVWNDLEEGELWLTSLGILLVVRIYIIIYLLHSIFAYFLSYLCT